VTVPEDLVARLALAHLGDLGPLRARWLLGGPAGAAEVVAALVAGRLPPDLGAPPRGVSAEVVERWGRDLAQLDPVGRWRAHREAGLAIVGPDDPLWPFAGDPEPPVVLWARGRLDLLARRPSAAVVGCRRCSAVGARVAHRLGRELTTAGVAVVSGLASGIDAAAHRGALTAGDDVVGVVGTGADVVYPRSSSGLWSEVERRGLLVGEAPLGTRGQRWRFPARNRLMAALAQVVVVVESHRRGGSLHTVAEAERRQVPVLAVPGSVLSSASDGTNQLLFEGAGVARDALDVLAALGLETVPRLPFPAAADVDPDARRILDQVSAGPVALDRLLPGRSLEDVALAVQRLVAAGLVEVGAGAVALSRP
jgi:DNA processing protein